MAKPGEADTNQADQWYEIRKTGEDDPQRAAFVDEVVKKLKRDPVLKRYPIYKALSRPSIAHLTSTMSSGRKKRGAAMPPLPNRQLVIHEPDHEQSTRLVRSRRV